MLESVPDRFTRIYTRKSALRPRATYFLEEIRPRGPETSYFLEEIRPRAPETSYFLEEIRPRGPENSRFLGEIRPRGPETSYFLKEIRPREPETSYFLEEIRPRGGRFRVGVPGGLNFYVNFNLTFTSIWTHFRPTSPKGIFG